MAQIGRINRLTIKRLRDYGAHLDGGESGDILLKKRDVPAKCRPGDTVEVFVYADRDERLRATTRKPYATAGQFAGLRVVATTAAGAFLDWGLEKDLFIPRREQQEKMAPGRFYVVFVFVDEKTKRITGSTKLDTFLSQEPPNYREGEAVELLIYDQTDLGYKALVNQTHGGMLYKNEVFRKLGIGQQLQGFIKKIRADHKIDLSLQRPGYQGVDAIARTILQTIKDQGGRINVTDNSPPAEIYRLFGVSKKTFKKAIGGLYKKRLIIIDPGGIRLVRR
jgi:hypothetical protein